MWLPFGEKRWFHSVRTDSPAQDKGKTRVKVGQGNERDAGLQPVSAGARYIAASKIRGGYRLGCACSVLPETAEAVLKAYGGAKMNGGGRATAG